MQGDIDTKMLDRVFELLAGRLELNRAEPVDIVVCGGSALIALGLTSRATKDVDVVSLLNKKRQPVAACPLPDFLRSAAREVADDLGLDENWLNSGPAELVQLGLPRGFLKRLWSRKYRKHLTVHFVGRLDQIHFKVYAAVDRGPGRHVDDLLALKPASDEMEAAAKWAMTHDVSPGFRRVLKEMLEKLGYEDVSKKI